MTPDERQLLSGLFDRIKGAATQQRDRDAETFIADAVRSQPYAPYLLSQTVIVQEQALRAANDKLQELEAKIKTLESGQGQAGQDNGFLGGLGRSIFGGGPSPARPAPQDTGYAQRGGYEPPPQYGQGTPMGGGMQQGGPWGQAAAAPGQGGSFLKGALGAAAGVAGGVLLANSISGLFHGSNNPFGIASGMGGLGGGAGAGGETIVNNYYEGDSGGGNEGGFNQASYDDGGGFDNSADFGSDDSSGSDGNYDV